MRSLLYSTHALRICRTWFWRCSACSLFFLLGCSQLRDPFYMTQETFPRIRPVVTTVTGNDSTIGTPRSSPTGIVQTQYVAPKEIPSSELPAPSVMPIVEGNTTIPQKKQLPIQLDTVFQLAGTQNLEINLAREQLEEAFAGQELAKKAWIPDLFVGMSYYRHEGGIQDFNGNLIHSSYGSLFGGMEINGVLNLRDAMFQQINAERKVWQKRGEVSKLTYEKLLDASTTYIDMLAAKAGESISSGLESNLNKVLEQTKNLAKVDRGVLVEAERIRSELYGQRRISREVQKGYAAASSKLVYLLGLNPESELVVLEPRFTPIALVDTKLQTNQLVEQALRFGPGIQEMEGLLAMIDHAEAESQGFRHYLPIVQMRLAEGGFGAGPGSSMDWDNRMDLGLQVRWNLRDAVTSRTQSRIFQSKRQQAHLSYMNLRSKLAMGVEQALIEIRGAEEQMEFAKKQIEHAEESFRLSEKRFNSRLPGSSATEVLLSLRSLGAAQLNYLTAIREYNKGQMQLFILTGKASAHCAQ